MDDKFNNVVNEVFASVDDIANEMSMSKVLVLNKIVGLLVQELGERTTDEERAVLDD